MLDKLRFSSMLFARSHNSAERTVLHMEKQGLGSHKMPAAFGQVSTGTLTVCDFTKYDFFFPPLQPYITLGRLNGINE